MTQVHLSRQLRISPAAFHTWPQGGQAGVTGSVFKSPRDGPVSLPGVSPEKAKFGFVNEKNSMRGSMVSRNRYLFTAIVSSFYWRWMFIWGPAVRAGFRDVHWQQERTVPRQPEDSSAQRLLSLCCKLCVLEGASDLPQQTLRIHIFVVVFNWTSYFEVIVDLHAVVRDHRDPVDHLPRFPSGNIS